MDVVCPRCELPIEPPNEEDDVVCPCCGSYVQMAIPSRWAKNVERFGWAVGIVVLLILILLLGR